MINRTLIRTKVVQTLFAYIQNPELATSGVSSSSSAGLTNAREYLDHLFSDTYYLYLLLLSFADELPRYADEQLCDRIARAQATHTYIDINRRFIDNRFSAQISTHDRLRILLDEHHLSWEGGQQAIQAIYQALLTSDTYQQYMKTPTPSAAEEAYEQDKKLWRHIYTELMPGNESVLSALEEMELVLDHSQWTTDLDYTLSYVAKSVRKFRLENGSGQALLEMFDNPSDQEFAHKLLRQAYNNREEYDQRINAHLKNWDPDRIARMDKAILYTALAEIVAFPDIALQISLNEYIEIAKEYSGDKNYFFINGILDGIIRELKRENKLLKAIVEE